MNLVNQIGDFAENNALFQVVIFLGLGLFALAGCGGSESGSNSNVGNTDTTSSYTIGGSVTGLTGSGLVLQNNGADDLSIISNGKFTFSTSLTGGDTFNVTVVTQPSGTSSQTCSVSNGSGTISSSNISNVTVLCSTGRLVGGEVTGLTGSNTVVLQNNSGNDLIASNGLFTFTSEVAEGGEYLVSVVTQPESGKQYCSVINGSGTVAAGSDVNSIRVHCVTGLFNVVDTMQTSCFNSVSGSASVCSGTGYDADYSGNSASFTSSADGKVVYDNITGLAWTQTADISGNGAIDIDDKLSQPNAVTYCSGLSYGGQVWRLPTVKELYSLMDFRGTDPSAYSGSDTSVLTPFIDDSVFGVGFGDSNAGERLIDGQYATTSLYTSPQGTIMGADTMFGVNFIDGRIKGYPYNTPANNPKTFYVYCVSGHADYGNNDFTDNGDATIIDAATGLRWQQDDYHSSDFEDAITYCESASTAGITSWRLPNIKELHSIVDYSRAPDYNGSAAIDPVFNTTSFSNEKGETDWGYYWASTTHISYPDTGNVASYIPFGRALGYFNNGAGLEVVDVHGAGAQRSNGKQSHAQDVSSANVGFGVFYYKGPQGDISRIDNWVRCVSND